MFVPQKAAFRQPRDEKSGLVPDEPEVRVRLNQFYDARLEAGKVDTIKRNILRINIPEQRPVRFRIRRVTFLEK